VMMIVLGFFHAFQGFIALFDDEYYQGHPSTEVGGLLSGVGA
jgi:hypothetical protein